MSGNGHPERNHLGHFAPGNKIGTGSPYIARVNEWRTAAAAAVNREDILAVMCNLVEAARDGQPWAIKELLDRTLGRAAQNLQIDQTKHETSELVIRVEMDGLEVT